MKLGEIAKALGVAVEGDADFEVVGLSGLEEARADELSFAAGEPYRAAFEASRAGAFVLPPDFEALGRPCLRSISPYVDFGRAIELLMPAPKAPAGVHPTAVVPDSVELGRDVSIGAYCVVGENVRIGDRSRLHPHATVYRDCVIGPDCEIHSGAHIRESCVLGARVVIQNGAVIGSDGFGFAFRPDGSRVRIPHRSGVHLADDVDVGANTTIDSSHPAHPRDGYETSATRIGTGVKIDNLVQVAHGCAVGDHSTLCSGVGLAGRTRVGKRVLFAGGAKAAGDLAVADGTVVLGMSGVMSDTEPGDQLLGIPGQPPRQFFRILAASKRLPELLKRVARLEGERSSGRSDT